MCFIDPLETTTNRDFKESTRCESQTKQLYIHSDREELLQSLPFQGEGVKSLHSLH